MAVHYSLNGRVAWIRLDKPQTLNALDSGMLDALGQAMDRAEADTRARVVVLTGQGRAFCAGGDIGELRADIEGLPRQPCRYIDAVKAGFEAVRRLRKPLIGAVNGVAVGGGLELLLCCDLVVAAKSARIGDGHANFGIFPGGGSSVLLSRVLPANLARQLLYTGVLWPAPRWHELGFVNQLVEEAELDAVAQALAEELAAKSPLLLKRLKQMIHTAADRPVPEALELELSHLRRHMHSADMLEGTTAFVEKRQPVYLDSCESAS